MANIIINRSVTIDTIAALAAACNGSPDNEQLVLMHSIELLTSRVAGDLTVLQEQEAKIRACQKRHDDEAEIERVNEKVNRARKRDRTRRKLIRKSARR